MKLGRTSIPKEYCPALIRLLRQASEQVSVSLCHIYWQSQSNDLSPPTTSSAAGLDSLQVFIVISALRGLLREQGHTSDLVHQLKPNLVYGNPTVATLSQAFQQFLEDQEGQVGRGVSAAGPRSLDLAEHLLRKYTSSPLPTPPTSPASLSLSQQ